MGYILESVRIYQYNNMVLSTFVVLLNAPFLIVLVKNRSLQTSSNAILGGLCCSDLITGILSVILTAINISKFEGSSETTDLYSETFQFCLIITGLSSLFMILVNLDRYFAICHPYKYLQYATAKRCTVISICTCLAYAATVGVSYAMDSMYKGYSTNGIIMVVIIVTALMLLYCTWKIAGVIRRHMTEICSIENSRDPQHSRFQCEKKRYRITVILVILFAFCKLPQVVSYVIVVKRDIQMTTSVFSFAIVSDSLLLLNCFSNPLVYYFRMQMFRRAMKKIFCCQSTI